MRVGAIYSGDVAGVDTGKSKRECVCEREYVCVSVSMCVCERECVCECVCVCV